MAKDAISRYEIAPEDTSAPAVASPVAPGGDAISRYEIAPDAPPSAAATPGGWGETISNALGYGAGLVGSFTHGLSFGLDRPVNALIASTFPNTAFARMQAENAQSQKDFDAAHPVVSTLAQAAGTVPGYAAGEGALAGSVLPPIARGGVVGTVGSAATSAARNALVNSVISAGLADGDLSDRSAAAWKGALVGGGAGMVGDVVGRGVNTMMGRSGGVAPETAQLAQTARNQYGIPINATQLAPDRSLLRIAADQSTHLPWSGAGPAVADQHAAFNRAVAHTFGETTDRVTPDVMDRAATRIGHDFDTVAARTNVTADPQFMNDLATIERDMTQTLTADEQGPIRTQLNNLIDAAANGNGTIPGNVYQALTRATAPLGRTARNANSNISYYGQAVRDALDDAFQRSAAPADQALLQQARTQYRAMRTVEDLVEKAPTGDLSPALLMGRVRAASDRFNPGTGGMAYTGGGPLGDLARIGQQFLRPQANSGTADRLAVNSLATGGAGGLTATNPLRSILAVPAGLGLNRIAGSILRSDTLANNLINSSLNPQAMEAYRYAPYTVPLANALASGNVPVQ